MARDEGLGNLEAFIATAQTTRAALQRDAERVHGLGQRLGRDLADVEARLADVDQAVEEFDRRHGDAAQVIVAMALAFSMGMVVGAPFGLFGLAALIILFPLAYWVSGELRPQVRDAGDHAIDAYRELSADGERLEGRLASAQEELEDAAAAFGETATAVAEAPGALLEDAWPR